jgi:hypothetical protein
MPEPVQVAAPRQPSVRGMALTTAAVAVVVLAGCNGLLVWLYQHSSIGVVVTLGTFIAGVSLAWLRNRSRQLTAIVLYVQALMVASIVVGVLVGLNAGVATGVLAAGITFVGLVLLSLIGLLYYTGERKPFATTVCLGTVIAVVAAMVVAYAFLSWYSPSRGSNQAARVAAAFDPGRSVDFLIEHGQYYTDSSDVDPQVSRSFENYTCPESRDEFIALFTGLVRQGDQHLATPENVKEVNQETVEDKQIATVTASISVVDDLDGSVIKGPQTWTFRLEKRPGDEYWRVCRIDRPS